MPNRVPRDPADGAFVTPRTALASLHAAVALFAFAALFGKWIALPATAIVLGRTTIAALTLAVVAAVRQQPVGRPGTAVLANGVILALHWVTFFAAVQIASVAVGLLGYASFPLFALLLERRAFTGPARRIDLAVALLAACGLAIVVPGFEWSSATSRGLALGIASGLTFAWLSVRNRTLVERMPPARIAFWQNVFAAACLLPIVAFVDRMTSLPTLADVGLLMILGVVCTGLAHTLFIASLQRLSAHTASVVAALEPVYGIVLALWLLHEVPSARTVVGGTLIVAAAFAASFRSREGSR